LSSKHNHSRQRNLPVKPINYKEARKMLQQIKVSNITEANQVVRLSPERDGGVVDVIESLSFDQVLCGLLAVMVVVMFVVLVNIWI